MINKQTTYGNGTNGFGMGEKNNIFMFTLFLLSKHTHTQKANISIINYLLNLVWHKATHYGTHCCSNSTLVRLLTTAL